MATPVDEWNADFLDLVDALSAAQVEFLVVGAFALAHHGLVRATSDIDFVVRATPENARSVFEALRAFGAPLASVGVSESDFASPGQTYQMGQKPRRIDILTQLSGVSFDDAWANRVVGEVRGRRVPYIGVNALRTNKLASGRPKDLADAAWLDSVFPRRES
jgi:hypothetical protein